MITKGSMISYNIVWYWFFISYDIHELQIMYDIIVLSKIWYAISYLWYHIHDIAYEKQWYAMISQIHKLALLPKGIKAGDLRRGYHDAGLQSQFGGGAHTTSRTRGDWPSQISFWTAYPDRDFIMIKVGVNLNVTVSRKKKKFKRRPSQYAQRAGSARKILHCVLIRATWPNLCFGINNKKVPSCRNYWFCHAGMGYYLCFRTFAENSLHFSFVSPGFELGPIAHILTVENFQ